MGETSLSTNEAFFLLLGLLIGISSMGGVLWYFLRERNRRIFELGEQLKLKIPLLIVVAHLIGDVLSICT